MCSYVSRDRSQTCLYGFGFTNMTTGEVVGPDKMYTFPDEPIIGEGDYTYTPAPEPMGPPITAKKPFPWWILLVAGTAWYLSNKG